MIRRDDLCPVFQDMPTAKCSGCEVCTNACPRDALVMQRDNLGFLYPKLQAEKCINCRKCNRVCPILNTTPIKNDCEIYYGASHTDTETLIQSASGGMFTFLVEQFKEMYPNGYIVGAVYSDNFKSIEHFLSDQHKDFLKMRSSKYFQSMKKNVYRRVQNKLEQGEAIFFSGCPCETAALYSYLGGKEYSKLWTMDFICKGSSSPRLLKEYIEYLEKKYKSEVNFLNMRYKWPNLDNWIPQFLMVQFKNGKRRLREFYNTELGIGFQILQRESCHDCPYRENRHYSDFTIGDLHGADEKSLIFNRLGVSVIIINNAKGKELWSSFDKSKIKFLELDKELVYSKNRNQIDSRMEKLKRQLESKDAVTAIRNSIGMKEKIKMLMPTMVLRKITSWRRNYKNESVINRRNRCNKY